MNIYLMIATTIANLLAIAIVYQFIKKLENKEKVIIIAISIATMYMLISITYWISGFGVDKTIHEQSKNFITYLFVPVNMILFVPYSAYQYVKLKESHMKKEKFLKKMMNISCLLLAVLVIEFFYFRNIQKNINTIGNNANNISNEAQESTVQNEIQGNAAQNENTNETQSNVVQNENANETQSNAAQNENEIQGNATQGEITNQEVMNEVQQIDEQIREQLN